VHEIQEDVRGFQKSVCRAVPEGGGVGGGLLVAGGVVQLPLFNGRRHQREAPPRGLTYAQ
jgi:hypothetical protein